MPRHILQRAMRDTSINMNFRTGTAGTCFSHFPEVIFIVKVADMRGINIRFLLPELKSFAIGFIDGSIELIFRNFPDLGQQFPSPGNCLFFVVITKTPVTEHFKKGVMIAIFTNFFQVIMFSPGTNTFLAINHASIGYFLLSQEDTFELIHSRIGKKQRFIIFRNHG